MHGKILCQKNMNRLGESMNNWIFQSVSSRFDLRIESDFYSGMDGQWDATRYRTKMQPGDRVFFWMGGEEGIRGIYGVGHLTSLPFEDADGHKVAVHVDKRLRQHVGIARVRQQAALANMMILRIAIGSNFLINDAEAHALQALIDGEA